MGILLSPCSKYRAILDTGGSYCTICALCNARVIVIFFVGANNSDSRRNFCNLDIGDGHAACELPDKIALLVRAEGVEAFHNQALVHLGPSWFILVHYAALYHISLVVKHELSVFNEVVLVNPLLGTYLRALACQIDTFVETVHIGNGPGSWPTAETLNNSDLFSTSIQDVE